MRITDELDHAEAALIRKSFLVFCIHALAPVGQAPAAHHRFLIAKLQDIADGAAPKKRTMVCLPPGSAKTTYVSRLFPAWYFGHRINDRATTSIIAASHTADLAESISKDVQNYVRDNEDQLGYGLETESVAGWITTRRGNYKPAGVGGPITGRRADLAIIDDPVKDRQTADSEADRNRVWNWYSSTLRTRLKPGAPVLLVMTRWHEDDLGGRLLKYQPHLWDVVSIPAQAVENDPLGREPGEWLWGDDTYNYAEELRHAKSEAEINGEMRDWSALYQQNPQPLEGALFKAVFLQVIPEAPVGGRDVRAWDIAATKQVGTKDPDWTVGIRLRRMYDGRFVVVNVVRFRGGPDEVERAILNTARQDGPGVTVGLPQDPGQAGKAQVLYFTRQLAGYRVESSPESGDKTERAAPVASQVNVGNFFLVNAAWNAPFINEFASFPSGTKDDQVDALSRAFMMLTAKAGPKIISDELLRAL